MFSRGSGYEWDDAKNQTNLAKHGIDFDDAKMVFETPITEEDDLRRDYGELRTIAYGLLGDEVIAVVYTWRNNTRRIISARRARRDERRRYRQIYPG